ncbi:MAG: GntR family transcriptional regulator [Hyphomicrobiales bacterium]
MHSVPLRERAYASFTEKLLARDILPGQIISQRELVELTGLPLGAIREMIPRLEADGLIQTVPKKGIQITNVDLNLVKNAFQLRQVLEREAIRSFCETALDSEIALFRDKHQEIWEAAQKAVTPQLLTEAQHVDWAFHDHIIDAMDNDLISNIYRVNSIKVRLIRNADTRMLPELVVSVFQEHMKVITALMARDVEASVQALDDHIRSAKLRALGIG